MKDQTKMIARVLGACLIDAATNDISLTKLNLEVAQRMLDVSNDDRPLTKSAVDIATVVAGMLIQIARNGIDT